MLAQEFGDAVKLVDEAVCGPRDAERGEGATPATEDRDRDRAKTDLQLIDGSGIAAATRLRALLGEVGNACDSMR